VLKLVLTRAGRPHWTLAGGASNVGRGTDQCRGGRRI